MRHGVSDTEYARLRAAADKLMSRCKEKNPEIIRPINYVKKDLKAVGLGWRVHKLEDITLLESCVDKDGTVDGVPVYIQMDVTLPFSLRDDISRAKKMLPSHEGHYIRDIAASPFETWP